MIQDGVHERDEIAGQVSSAAVLRTGVQLKDAFGFDGVDRIYRFKWHSVDDAKAADVSTEDVGELLFIAESDECIVDELFGWTGEGLTNREEESLFVGQRPGESNGVSSVELVQDGTDCCNSDRLNMGFERNAVGWRAASERQGYQ